MLASRLRRLSKRLVWVRRRFAGRPGRVSRRRARRGDDGCRRRAGIARAVVEMFRRARVLTTIYPARRAARSFSILHTPHHQSRKTEKVIFFWRFLRQHPSHLRSLHLRDPPHSHRAALNANACAVRYARSLRGSRWPRGGSRRMPWMTSSWYARDADSRLLRHRRRLFAAPRRPAVRDAHR